MQTIKSKSLSLLLVTTLIAACTEPNGAPGRGVEHGGAISKTDVGTVVGAVGGGVLGSTIGGGAGRTVAIIGGTLLGGVLGNMVGQSLDNADRAAYDRASQRAMETGETETWRNSNSGHHGSITPRRHYYNKEGQYCREYTQTIYVDGKPHTGHGTACRESDGTWQIVE